MESRNEESGITNADAAEKSGEKLIQDPKPKKLFVPYARGRRVYSKQASLTALDRKGFREFAALAKQRFKERRDNQQ